MKIKVHSSELNHMMKTVGQCVDTKKVSGNSNVEISHNDNMLTIRATNGTISAKAQTPLMGGDGETFCVDGQMFGNVVRLCSGETEISTDGRNCVIRSVGRTRIPIVDAEVPEAPAIEGDSVTVNAGDFAACYGKVAYAVSTEQTRIQLTGVLVETDGLAMKMVALDGFQLAIENVQCQGDNIRVIIPGAFMRLVASSVTAEDTLHITTDGKRLQVQTDDLLLTCSLLAGEYIDYQKILHQEFKTESLVKVEQVKNALKSSSAINSAQKLIRFVVGPETMQIQSNSEAADFEAEISCDTRGDGLTIAFNSLYITNAMNAISGEEAVMHFNSPMTPVVVKAKDADGTHLLLPVRVFGGQ